MTITLSKYLKVLIIIFVCAFFTNQSALAEQATFSWLPNNSSDGTVGYMLHYGTSSHVYTKSIDVGAPAPVGGRIYAGVSQLVAGQKYFFTVTAYNAKGVQSAYPNEIALTVSRQVVPNTVIRINAGGEKYTDRNGNVWSADFGYNTGHKTASSVSISKTDDDSLFQTQRWDDAMGNELSYSVNVPNGDYIVNLYFAENFSKVFYPNGRLFDILLEGKTVEYKMDIYDEAGKNTALMKSYEVNVADGQLNLMFLHGIENPTVSAIEIISN